MKKIIFILIGLLVLGGGIYFLAKNSQQKQPSPLSQKTQASPTPSLSQNTKKYLDQETGFSFEYPDNLEATKSENIKDTVYADLKITGKIKGNIRFLIEDATAKTVADYLTKNKLSTTGAQIISTKLADLPAEKYLFSDKIWILMLDQNVIYWLNADLKDQSQFWTITLDKVASSFAFEKVETASNAGGGYSDAGDVVDEGEESVE